MWFRAKVVPIPNKAWDICCRRLSGGLHGGDYVDRGCSHEITDSSAELRSASRYQPSQGNLTHCVVDVRVYDVSFVLLGGRRKLEAAGASPSDLFLIKTSEWLIIGNRGGNRGNQSIFKWLPRIVWVCVFGLGLKESRPPKKALSLRITAG